MFEVVLVTNQFFLNYLRFLKDQQALREIFRENGPIAKAKMYEMLCNYNFDRKDQAIIRFFKHRGIIDFWNYAIIFHILHKFFQGLGGYEFQAKHLEKKEFGISMEDSRELVTDIWGLIELYEGISPGFKERTFHYIIHFNEYFLTFKIIFFNILCTI